MRKHNFLGIQIENTQKIQKDLNRYKKMKKKNPIKKNPEKLTKNANFRKIS